MSSFSLFFTTEPGVGGQVFQGQRKGEIPCEFSPSVQYFTAIMPERGTQVRDMPENDTPESDMKGRDTPVHDMREHDNWRHKKLSFLSP